MEKNQLTVAELSSLLRMIPVIPDADSPARIYEVLLAFCTAWQTIGVDRAFLLPVDVSGRVVRGHLASERVADEGEPPTSFEMLARRVVDSTRRIETSDLTLKARTFSVPLDWQRCAVVKAATNGIPVLADRRASEFSSDPFFDFFETSTYVAIPLRVDGRVTAVLAADRLESAEPLGVEDISLIYSMAQQASSALDRLRENGDNARKFRVLRKLQEVLASAESTRRFGDSLSAILSMVSRAMGGDGALLKDLVRNKTTHVKSIDDVDAGDRDTDIAVTECFDDIMDRVAGTVKPLRGDSGHALLTDAAAQAVQQFVALPLVAGGECLGAVIVYTNRRATDRESEEFPARDRLFLELCAGMLAERLDSLYKADLLFRSERMFDEVQSHLTRERTASRVGARAQEQVDALIGGFRVLRDTIGSLESDDARVGQAREILDRVESEATQFQEELAQMKSSLRLVDLFALTREIVEAWLPRARERGADVTVRIPDDGPVMLMDRDSIATALRNILDVLADHLAQGDRVLVECSASPGRAVVLVADTAGNLDGTLLSRLFMPFTQGGAENDDPKTAMSAAGDILQRHGGEITVRSSPSWKTILGISFASASNTDRRSARRDRRRHPDDRRHSD